MSYGHVATSQMETHVVWHAPVADCWAADDVLSNLDVFVGEMRMGKYYFLAVNFRVFHLWNVFFFCGFISWIKVNNLWEFD